MNVENEYSKVYRLIDILSIFIVIICGVRFMANIHTVMSIELFDMLLILLGLSKMLSGTKKVVAQKNKKGYFDYIIATISFVWAIGSIF